MLNALRLLEVLGSEAVIRSDRARTIREAALPDDVRSLIQQGAIEQLRQRLQCAHTMYCAVFAPDNDEPAEEPQREDQPAEQDEPKAD